jgi:vacuolar-type H+-ATPase subunit C/Vma6
MAMLRTSRYSYILAKMYGMLAKSNIGANFREILRLKKLEDLFALLFPGEREVGEQNILIPDLERKIAESGMKSMIKILDLLDSPPPLLLHIVRRYEYLSVKAVIRFLLRGAGGDSTRLSGTSPPESERPRIWDLGPYGSVKLAGPRDYREALRRSSFSWILPLIPRVPAARIQIMMDRDYYLTLHELARQLPRRDRTGVLRLLSAEIACVNAVWALRLRFFFGIGKDDAKEFLLPAISGTGSGAVRQVFDIPADSIEGWRGWRFAWLLEGQFGEEFQAPDPIRAQRAASRRLYEMAHTLFHQDSYTLTPIAAFFKLKEYEAGVLTTAVEALRLSVPEQEVLSQVGSR